MARKAQVRYPDFTIVYRADRKGYEGWYGGKGCILDQSISLLLFFLVIWCPPPHTGVLKFCTVFNQPFKQLSLR